MAICDKCGKDFESGVKAAYKLGLQDGRQEYDQHLKSLERKFHIHLNKVERLFAALWEEICIMDLRTPDKANKVYFSRIFLNRLLKSMNKHKPPGYYYWSRIIIKAMDEQIGEAQSAEAELRRLLEEIGPDS